MKARMELTGKLNDFLKEKKTTRHAPCRQLLLWLAEKRWPSKVRLLSFSEAGEVLRQHQTSVGCSVKMQTGGRDQAQKVMASHQVL